MVVVDGTVGRVVGGFVVVDQSALGFGAAEGDRLFLFRPGETAVADAVDVQSRVRARPADGSGEFLMPGAPTFGTPELATHVRDALAGRHAALMANHGSVATGASLAKAVDNALLLEWLCQLHHRASALGTPRVLDADQQADVIRVALERGYGTPKRREQP